MTCFHPIKAYRSRDRGPNGKYAITFNPMKNLVEGSSSFVPCGQCIGCRLARARERALRCVHEAKMWEHNCFITLTYDDDHMPADGSVAVRATQLFMKRLREKFAPKPIRFLAVGEYGGLTLRPHYHLLVFNHWFPDQKKWQVNKKTNTTIYISEQLSKLWTFGFSTVGPVNYKTAGYVARYAMKKQTGERAPEHYTRPHCVTGNLVRVRPEFVTASSRPGLGYGWLQKFKADCYPSDYLIVDGHKHPVPKYYDKKLKEEAERELEKLKRRRRRAANEHREDQTKERLAVREEVQEAKVKRLVREL